MLRHLGFTVVCLLVFTLSASAQQLQEDVIYLRDGSIVRGVIIDNNAEVKIRLRGGVIRVIKVADISKLSKQTKELPMQPPATVVIKNEKSPKVARLWSCLFPGGGTNLQ